MATESSSVFVAVRVRPFSTREDTACCTITVPDTITISVLDVPTLIPSSTAGGPAAGGQHGEATAGNSGSAAKNPAAFNHASFESLRHSYSFDKIFWSVAPSVLPFPPPSVLDALSSGDGGDAVGGRKLLPGLALPNAAQRALLSHYSSVSKHLPCFANPPAYDDQQRVYDFIGPRMHDAVMSGFNACLFAYGQTGSGKSYSMIGPTEAVTAAVAAAKGATGTTAAAKGSSGSNGGSTAADTAAAERGIMPRLFSDLFRRMREERAKDESVTFTAEVSFLEIYCEKVRDLLAVAGGTTTSSSSSGAYFAPSASTGGSLRIRQHPSQGPYVEGLTHVKVRDEESVLRYLLSGLRDRATAGTNMNEHSSRSHAILQLQVTKVVADADEATGAVVTRTCVSKATMVDLAGSERVSQSGVSGDRFEEAKNINLSLSTLGRVIQQLSEKQSGRHVIPAYRDSVLTWLLSDSLGGNSKTIMLATVAPSAYCYQQTLNTLRFAGVAKKVVNVASVNEDRHFQQLIAEMRQQIVRLTLQLESGKAAEVHLEKIEALRREREELMAENDALKAKVTTAADTTVLQALRRRVKELEGENAQLRSEGQTLQERMLASTAALREDVAQQRAEVLQLHETLAKKESEVTEWANRYRALVLTTTSPVVVASSTAAGNGRGNAGVNGSGAGGAAAAAAATGGRGGGASDMVSAQEAQRAQQKLQEEVKQLKTKLHKSTQDSAAAQRARQEAIDAHKETSTSLDEFKVRYEEVTRQLDLLHQRMQSTTSLLETTQCELTAMKARSSNESAKSRAVEDALEASSTVSTNVTAQLNQMRSDYLEEKQRNVELLLRVAQVEQERAALRRTVEERVSDTCELEQLLLEETENAERFYMRMRYHRYSNELLHRFVTQLQHLQHMTGRREQRGSGAARAVDPSADLSQRPSSTARLHPDGGGEDGRVGDEESPQGTLATHSQANGNPEQMRAMRTSTAAAEETTRLLSLQLCYACQSEEAQGRAAVEVECMNDLTRLAAQRSRLRQLTTAALTERLAEAEDTQRALRDEVAFYKQKMRASEEEYEDEVQRHQADTAALQVAEMHRLRLERKVAALEDITAELEGGRDSLIAKVAQLQEQQSVWQARCAEAEQVAAEVQDWLMPGSASSALSNSTDGAGEEGRPSSPLSPRQQQPQRMTSALTQLDRVALATKARAAQDALDAHAALEQQCEDYRTEIGALRAQLEQTRTDKQDAVAQLARNDQTLQQAETRHTESSEQLMHEIGTITRDYESRIRQQQTMMQTLRHALEEETAMADLCRQSAQRAEASRQAQEEELVTTREQCEERRRREAAMADRCAEMQAELDQLRDHFGALEQQLAGLRRNEPDLYLLLEKGLGEDGPNWLGKVHSEKLRLQKQRSEAQQLNSELMEHVRDGNTRLRDVQKQLTNVSFVDDSGPNSSAMTKASPSEDEEELARTVRKPRR